jgi:hypothetical protein
MNEKMNVTGNKVASGTLRQVMDLFSFRSARANPWRPVPSLFAKASKRWDVSGKAAESMNVPSFRFS